MFNYFLSDEYGYEDSEYRNDINEFDDLISQFWQDCNLMDNKLIKVFSIQLLNNGIDLPSVLNLNQSMIVNNKRIRDIIIYEIKRENSKSRASSSKSLLSIENNFNLTHKGTVKETSSNFIMPLLLSWGLSSEKDQEKRDKPDILKSKGQTINTNRIMQSSEFEDSGLWRPK